MIVFPVTTKSHNDLQLSINALELIEDKLALSVLERKTDKPCPCCGKIWCIFWRKKSEYPCVQIVEQHLVGSALQTFKAHWLYLMRKYNLENHLSLHFLPIILVTMAAD